MFLTAAAQADPDLGFLGALSSRPAFLLSEPAARDVANLLLANFGVFVPAVENMSCSSGGYRQALHGPREIAAGPGRFSYKSNVSELPPYPSPPPAPPTP